MTEQPAQKFHARRALAENLRQLIRIGAPYGLPRSPAELACRAGLPPASVGKWIGNQGKKGPTTRYVEALAAVYGLESWELLFPDWPDRDLLARILVSRPAHSG